MTRPNVTTWLALAATAALAACVETEMADDRLSDDIVPPAGMEPDCIAQATRLTGVPEERVLVESRIETGGGPFIGLRIDGASYGCRLEDDGSVTVFSQFAN